MKATRTDLKRKRCPIAVIKSTVQFQKCRQLFLRVHNKTLTVIAAYAIGAVAMFWVIQRTAAIW